MTKNFLCLVAVLALSGCLELPDLSDNDGDPASPSQIQEKMEWAWGTDYLDGRDINLNETVSLSRTVQVMGSAPREFEAQTMQVHAINETTDDSGKPVNEFRIIIATGSATDGNSQKPPLITEHGYQFPRASTSLKSSSMTQDFFPPRELTAKNVHSLDAGAPPLSIHNFLNYYLACVPDPKSGWNPTCFNLRNWTSSESAPIFLRNEAGCGGLSNCRMNVRHVAYDLVTDMVDENNGSEIKTKTLIHMQFSPDVPYLSRLVSFCFQGLGKYEDTPYVATVCTDVTRFQRGTRPAGP